MKITFYYQKSCFITKTSHHKKAFSLQKKSSQKAFPLQKNSYFITKIVLITQKMRKSSIKIDRIQFIYKNYQNKDFLEKYVKNQRNVIMIEKTLFIFSTLFILHTFNRDVLCRKKREKT